MVDAEAPVETKQCSNCERQIEVSKIRMHEIGCARQYYKCKECGEIVAKGEREEHEEEAHRPVKCQYCSYEAPAAKFGQHEDTCEMRPKECPWCGKTFRIEQYVDHEELCGSRTEKCDDCERYVKRREKADHKSSG